ncbi:hypothetical protein BCR44DRAFT_1248781 [Catenaria anguillulae PL171]|uniref:Uncharacterized protein n=1 Tax=Catenaria anguillulae PL171 TaxID=765915 RepID=A0A1Y2HY09_9FUNG|nr:hypothetical protein BCR44DRAFT_1248781 [Catenaria anguillulae PL171]
MPLPTTLRTVLTSITKSCPDPLRSPLFDPFQSLLLLSLVGASFPTLDHDPGHIDAAINAVFISILSTSPAMTDHDQWRIICLAKPLATLSRLLAHLSLASRAQVSARPVQHATTPGVACICARVSFVPAVHVACEPNVKDALVKFRELYIETAPPPSAGLKLMDLCPPVGESLHPADDAPVPVCFLWLLDQVVDAVERDRLVRRLLPVKFTGVPVTAQRLLLALFLRSQLDVTNLVSKLDLSIDLVSVVLPELLDTLTDSTKDQALYLKMLDFALLRLESDSLVESRLQAPLIRFLVQAQAQRPALAEDCLLARHAVFRKLLSAHMPLAVRASALELMYAILRRTYHCRRMRWFSSRRRFRLIRRIHWTR